MELDKIIGPLLQYYKEWTDSHNIVCPFWGYEFDETEKYDFTTMHGEESEIESECPNCEKPLIIEENVDRTWEVRKNDE
jgi:hypothetical protein